ncbi:MAG: AI-2E family transporter [Muribaculaceae bacterium]|nr:AI-2E family transporter [Roseburia sp.]MCM1431654.1 AI-2E family transporter [Muribaculaceae bacterium]MCM1491674.1 AI-2E family transporter [Muribaculaceae bacterium]
MPEVDTKKQNEQTPPLKAAGQETPSAGRHENIWLAKIGLMIFITFACCILFFFVLLRYEGFASGWKKIMKAAEPIIIGLILAYLLNPIMKIAERQLMKLLEPRMKSEQKVKKLSRVLAVIISILFLLVVIALLIAAVVPSVISSISGLIDSVPVYVQNFTDMAEKGVLGHFEVTEVVADYLTRIMEYVEDWAKNTLLPQAQGYVVQITNSVISVVKALLNFVVGIIVAVYVLMIKEELIGQSKKLVFATFRPKWGNVVIEFFRKADEIFGGFIIGKITDSAIIGVICYVGCLILRIPDALLVAVIIGVTNIIPVFGPFIGAVPALLLVVIQSPWHALYLLIFIIVLQQVDGNIIGPKILGSSTGLSSFWVMFAILIAGGMFGFLGMLLGVPMFAMVYYVIRRLVNRSIQKKGLPSQTESYVRASGVNASTRSMIYQEEPKKKKRK